MMMIVKNYTFQGVEYMVCNTAEGYVPGTAARELLADRRHGVGADRILFVNPLGGQELQVFAADGRATEAGIHDWLIFALYLRQEGLTANAAEFARELGDQALVRVQTVLSEVSFFEAHVTTAFCHRLEAIDKGTEMMAC